MHWSNDHGIPSPPHNKIAYACASEHISHADSLRTFACSYDGSKKGNGSSKSSSSQKKKWRPGREKEMKEKIKKKKKPIVVMMMMVVAVNGKMQQHRDDETIIAWQWQYWIGIAKRVLYEGDSTGLHLYAHFCWYHEKCSSDTNFDPYLNSSE